MALLLVLIITFGFLAIGLLWYIYLAIREKFTNKRRLISIGIVSILLALSFFYPGGIINFKKFEAKDLLFAEAEGAANCHTSLKLKANNKFVEESVCFGVFKVSGNYVIKGDSIFFSNIKSGRGDNEYYQFAVIGKFDFQNDKIFGELKRFRNYGDTLPDYLFITKNEFKK